MNSNPDRPYILYVADAYCGWCFGFSPRLREFESENRQRIEFRVISGGLFIGERALPLAAYPHIPEANERIARLTGVRFGERYNRLVKQGTFVMDSRAAAAGLAALRAQDPSRSIHFLHRLQDAFYVDGRSLSDREVIIDIARSEGLNIDIVRRLLDDHTAALAAQTDFAMARRMGVGSYPTLLFVHDEQTHRLPATGTALSVLNSQLSRLLDDSKFQAA